MKHIPEDGSEERRNASEYQLNRVTWCKRSLALLVCCGQSRQSAEVVATAATTFGWSVVPTT